MDGKRIAALAALTLLAVVVSATELHCIFDEQLCDTWADNAEASQGNYNGIRFCCPPEPGQGITITGFPPDPEHCTCKAGTAEKYNQTIPSTSTTTTPASGGNSASGLMPYSALAVILLSIAGVSLY